MDAHQSNYSGAGVTDAVFHEHRQGVDDGSAREQSGDLKYQQEQQQLLQQQEQLQLQQQQHEAVSHYVAQASAGYIADQSGAHLQVQIPCLCNSATLVGALTTQPSLQTPPSCKCEFIPAEVVQTEKQSHKVPNVLDVQARWPLTGFG